jgi:hypothetical protein
MPSPPGLSLSVKVRRPWNDQSGIDRDVITITSPLPPNYVSIPFPCTIVHGQLTGSVSVLESAVSYTEVGRRAGFGLRNALACPRRPSLIGG